MVRDTLLDQLSGTNPRPNKFTIGVGKLIRAAREEAGYSQRELAELIYRRQATLSDIENGKMEPDATTLLTLAFHLNKQIQYFYPSEWKPLSVESNISDQEQEIIALIRKLDQKDIKKIIAQLRAIVNLE